MFDPTMKTAIMEAINDKLANDTVTAVKGLATNLKNLASVSYPHGFHVSVGNFFLVVYDPRLEACPESMFRCSHAIP